MPAVPSPLFLSSASGKNCRCMPTMPSNSYERGSCDFMCMLGVHQRNVAMRHAFARRRPGLSEPAPTRKRGCAVRGIDQCRQAVALSRQLPGARHQLHADPLRRKPTANASVHQRRRPSESSSPCTTGRIPRLRSASHWLDCARCARAETCEPTKLLADKGLN